MVVRSHLTFKSQTRAGDFQIFIGRVVHSKSLTDLEILPHAAIGVRPDGTIAFVDAKSGSPEDVKARYTSDGFSQAVTTVLEQSQFLFPGMVDTHLHAPQWPNLALGMEGTLREWVEHWTDPIEESYHDNDKAKRVYADVTATTLKLGSTTVAYNSSIHAEATKILADSAFRVGQRAIIGKMNIVQGSTRGNWEKSNEASLEDSEKLIKHILEIDADSKLIHACIQPRGGSYCPPELMKGLGGLREKYDTYVQSHMCETLEDIERMLKVHPQFDCYTDMYRAYGLLNNKSIQAHCIHLQPKDIENMRATNAGVAHNPNSNTCLRDGECRVRDLLDAGIKVGLGTDCSAGYMPSIQDAMKNASNVSRHLAMKLNDDKYILSFREVVYLATMGGAKVVCMEDKIGNFENDKHFDALVIEARGIVSADPQLWEHGEGGGEAMVKKWVFLGDDRNIKKVFVNGKLVMDHDLAV